MVVERMKKDTKGAGKSDGKEDRNCTLVRGIAS